MSPLRIATLISAIALSTVAGVELAETATTHGALTTARLQIECALALLASLIWITHLATWVIESVTRHVSALRARIDGRFDELAGQLAAVAEMVGEYGDLREDAGAMRAIRESLPPSVRRIH